MQNKDLMWAYLIHIGYNMWAEKDAGQGILADGYAEDYYSASDKLRFDMDVWELLTDNMAKAGINTLVIDLGEGIRYESHPEIAVEGSLSKEQFAAMLAKLRQKGITPIPKLNFSTCHDEWLGRYARCVCSSEYYAVCRDLIAEAAELFGKPAYFHLGMDEETYEHQVKYRYALVRNGEQWWNDLMFYAKAAEENGARPWFWSDRIWNHEKEFLERMPKEFLQSNWYYDGGFDRSNKYVGAYNVLGEYGYEQVPAGSNWCCQWNFEGTVNYCSKTCNKGQLAGFLQTVWRPTLDAVKYRHLEAIDTVRQARENYNEA